MIYITLYDFSFNNKFDDNKSENLELYMPQFIPSYTNKKSLSIGKQFENAFNDNNPNNLLELCNRTSASEYIYISIDKCENILWIDALIIVLQKFTRYVPDIFTKACDKGYTELFVRMIESGLINRFNFNWHHLALNAGNIDILKIAINKGAKNFDALFFAHCSNKKYAKNKKKTLEIMQYCIPFVNSINLLNRIRSINLSRKRMKKFNKISELHKTYLINKIMEILISANQILNFPFDIIRIIHTYSIEF
jgi:hypothetical protein